MTTTYTFNAILTEQDENWTAVRLERVDLELGLYFGSTFSYSFGDKISFVGGEVVRMIIDQGTLFDTINFEGYNDSFEAYDPIISEYSNVSDERYILIEQPFKLNGTNHNLLFEIYSEGDHFDQIQTLDDWFDNSQRKSQILPEIAAYKPGVEIDYNDVAALSLASKSSSLLGSGDDILEGNDGDDVLRGGAGDDTITGGAGDDTLDGGSGNDTIDGGAGNDIIDGGAGDDEIHAGDGNDTVYAGNGNDRVHASFGVDHEDGGDGVDTFVLDGDLTYVPVIDLTLKTAYLYGEQPDFSNSIVNFENIEVNSNTDFVLIGDENDNIISGGAGNDLLDGGDGNDTLQGGEGSDNLDGGEGSDNLDGGEGDDTLDGGGGDDFLRSRTGSDILVGGDGSDLIIYGDQAAGIILNNTSILQDGVAAFTTYKSATLEYDTLLEIEHIQATHFDDAVYTENDGYTFLWSGDDKIYVDAGNVNVMPGSGNDEINGLNAANVKLVYYDDGDSVDGTIANVTSGIHVTYFADGVGLVENDGWGFIDTFTGVHQITGNSLDDRIFGAEGDDVFSGEAGDDMLRGGAGDDILEGGDGNDILDGGDGDDYLDGGAGDDNLTAGDGNDTLIGGDGDDALHDDWGGNDHFDGGNGTDSLFLPTKSSGASIDVQAGTVRSYFNPPQWSETPAQDEVDTFVSIEIFGGTDYDDTFLGSDGDESFSGRDGDDTLIGGGGNDTLEGGDGDDHYEWMYEGQTTITDTSGFDNVRMSSGERSFRQLYKSGDDLILEGSKDGVSTQLTMTGIETITWTNYTMSLGESGEDSDLSNVMYVGSLGADTIVTGQGDYVEAYGAEGDDYITILGGGSWATGDAGDDTLIGGEGDDYLKGDYTTGDDGDDSLVGGGGNDRLEGNKGNDSLDGGAGEDIAIYFDDFADAEIYIQGDAIFVETATNGVDQLTNIEYLQFADRTVGVNVDGLDGTSYDPTTEIYAYRINGMSINGEDNANGDWVIQSEPTEAVTIVYGSADLEFSFIEDRTYEDDYSHLMSVSQGELYDLQINGMSVGDPRLDVSWTALETVQLGADSNPVQIFSVDGIVSLYEGWSWGSKEVSNVLYVDDTPLFESVPTKAELQYVVNNVDGGTAGYFAEAADSTVIKMSDIADGVRVSDIPNSNDGITTEYDVAYDGDITELSFSGFSLIQTWTEEDDSDEIVGSPSEATLKIRGSADLEIYSEAFFGDDYDVDPNEYDQELRILSGEIYEIELNGKPLVQEDGGELYTFIQNVVSPTFGNSVVFGMELIKGNVAQTNIFYLSGDKFGASGIPTSTELEKLIVEAETGKGSFTPLADGPFQFSDYSHVKSSSVDTTEYADTTPPSAPIISAIAEDGVLTQDELSNWSISGTAEAYSTVTLAFDGDPMGAVTTTAAADGTWQITGADLEITSIGDLPPGGDGDYGFTVTATDTAGNTSEETTGNMTLDVEEEIQGVGVRVASEIANMASHVQALTQGAAIAAVAQTLRTSIQDSADDDAGNLPDVATLLAAVDELQEFDLSTAINEVSSGGAVSLRATAENTAVSLDLGNSTGSANLEKTIVINDYATVVVTGEAKIRGGEGSNTFVGDSAAQDVMMGADDDNLNAGGGNDKVGSAGGNDTISGGSGNDWAFGGTGDDSVSGGSGNDQVLDSWGADFLSGGTGDDTIRSFDGGDTIDAGEGADTVYGGYGDDTIKGGAGNDVLYGDTVLFASRGNDVLEGGAGDDILQGGYGEDTFIFNAGADGNDTIGRIGGGADFESGIDHVELVGFSSVSTSNVMAHVSDVGGKAVFDAEGITITFDGLVTADLNADDFDFV